MKLPKPKAGSGEFELIDDGVYRAEFTKAKDPEPSRFANDAGEYPLRMECVFTIRDEESEFDGATVREWFNWESATHEKSKFYPYLKALLGRDYDEDEDADLDIAELEGKHIMLTIATKTKKNGTVVSAPAGAAPIRAKKKPKAAPKPAEDDDLWDEEDAA